MPEHQQIIRALLAIETRLDGIEHKLHALIRGDNSELNKIREELRVSAAGLNQAIKAVDSLPTSPKHPVHPAPVAGK